MKRWHVIASGFLFVAGNATWRFVKTYPYGEPKLFWFPLAIFLAVLVAYAGSDRRKETPPTFTQKTLLGYFVTLALGNIIKQAFYTEGIFQWNDYIFGAVVTVALIITLTIKWVTRKSGKK